MYRRIDNFKIFSFTTIGKNSMIIDNFKMFIRDVLNNKSNEIKNRTSDFFFFVVNFINIRKSDIKSIIVNNARLSNNRSFEVTSNVRKNGFEGRSFRRKVNIPRFIFSLVVFLRIEKID